MKKILLTFLFASIQAFISLPLHAETTDGAFFNVSASGALTLQISTTIPGQTYPTAGIKINSPGYGLAEIGTQCTLASNGYCLFSASNSSPTTLTLVGESGTVDMTLCLQGNGPTNCQNYSVDFTSRLYVTNFTSTVSVCPILSDGTFSTCLDAGQEDSIIFAVGIALNNAGTLAYVVNTNNGATNNILVFPVNSDGTFGGLIQTFPFTLDYGGITFNAAGDILYLTNTTDGSVYLCTLNLNGTINTCDPSSAGPLAGAAPIGITLNKAETYAYIGDQDGGTNDVFVCAIAMDGDFTSCTSSGITFSDPTTVALNEDQTVAYVTNYGGSTVSICLIDPSDGTFNSCEASASSFDAPWGIARNEQVNVIYVSDGANMAVCTIDMLTCDVVSDPTFDFTTGIFVSY